MRRNSFVASLVLTLCAAAIVGLASAASAATVEVHLTGSTFSPSVVHANAGDEIKFINDDAFDHDVTFATGASSPGPVHPGTNWTRAVSASDNVKFRCSIHSSSFDTGMVGHVVIGSSPPPPKSPGFELVGAIAAVGLVAFLSARKHRA